MIHNPADKAEQTDGIDPKLLEFLVCPLTKSVLHYDRQTQELVSQQAKLAYPIREGIPIIFPEGTRRAIDSEPVYHAGVSMLYAAMDVPCLPLAHNAGLFWPNGYIPRASGTILVEILPPIPPGMDRATFQTEIQTQLEAASNRLIAEGRNAHKGSHSTFAGDRVS